MAYDAGCIAKITNTDGVISITILTSAYKGSKQLTIFDGGVFSNSRDSKETLFSSAGASYGMMAGYYGDDGRKHVIELTKRDLYWYLPGVLFNSEGRVYLTEYASLNGRTQTTNTVSIFVGDGCGVIAENTPEDTAEWRDTISKMITSQMSSYTPVLKNALSITKSNTEITNRETGTSLTTSTTINYTGASKVEIPIADHYPAAYPLILKYTDKATNTQKYYAYYGDEKVSINLDDVINAMKISGSGGNSGALTITGKSKSYTYDGTSATTIDLKSEVTAIMNSLLDGDSQTY